MGSGLKGLGLEGLGLEASGFKASAFEFRYRLWIFIVNYALGFVAPWDLALHLDGSGLNAHVWLRMAVMLSRNGAMEIGAAFNAVLIAGIVCACLGAWMRTWGSAYLTVDVMSDASMRGDSVIAEGPYRYLRNPLYVGNSIHSLALALLMPASGDQLYCGGCPQRYRFRSGTRSGTVCQHQALWSSIPLA